MLTSSQAYDLLMDAKRESDGGYVLHSLLVGEAAARIASRLGLEKDKARTLGYIHDIGKRYGTPWSQHPARGYEYLRGIGVPREYANICLTHSYLNNDIDCTAGGPPSPSTYRYDFMKQFIATHPYTAYERIINLCDLMCKEQFMLLEERLIDLITRKGAYDNTQYHVLEAIRLKEQTEAEMGCSLYCLFPEIEQRLFQKGDNPKIKQLNGTVYSKTMI